MARNVQNLVLFCLCDELRLQVSVLRNPEVAIVLAAELRVCLVDVVPTRFVEEIVKHLGLDLRLLLVSWDATSLVLEAHVQAGYIDAPARRCVIVSTRRVFELLPVADNRTVRGHALAEELLVHDVDCAAGRTHVLLDSAVDDVEAFPVDGPRANA